jgi:homoserine acetyltransferase
MWQERLPTRAAATRFVNEGQGPMGWPDANDLIYMMELNDGFDAWSRIDNVACPVLMINMAGDHMVPIELGHTARVAERLQEATYVEVTDEAAHGHGALRRTFDVWGPRLREWLQALPRRDTDGER